MTGYFITQLRKKLSGITQAELARALEVSPVTINRWENNDPRYKPSDKESRLLEALDELSTSLQDESARRELRDLLRVSTVAGVIGKAAIERLLKLSTITLLAATPGLGWLGMVADIGVGAALPFFSKARVGGAIKPPGPDQIHPSREPHGGKPPISGPGSRKKPASAPASASLYSLSIETL
jgi:transcriptional regulator with XRE-family HTH domain